MQLDRAFAEAIPDVRGVPRRGESATVVGGVASLTVLVLNWNGESDTAACLDSLLVQRGVALDVVLIDNASEDGSGERLRNRYPKLQYLQTGENLGYAGGNNVGIAWARERGAEWILVLNNDTVVEPECLRTLLDAAETDPRLAAVAPLIVRFDDPSRVWFAGGHLSEARAIGIHEHEYEPVDAVLLALGADLRSPHPRGCTFLTGCCLLLRSSAIDAVGVFDADYFAYLEDAELSLRFRRAGWRLGWVPGARVRHRVPPHGAPPTPWQIRQRDRNRRRMVRDWFPLPRRLAFLLWFWPTRVAYLGRYVLARDWARARAILAGLAEA